MGSLTINDPPGQPKDIEAPDAGPRVYRPVNRNQSRRGQLSGEARSRRSMTQETDSLPPTRRSRARGPVLRPPDRAGRRISFPSQARRDTPRSTGTPQTGASISSSMSEEALDLPVHSADPVTLVPVEFSAVARPVREDERSYRLALPPARAPVCTLQSPAIPDARAPGNRDYAADGIDHEPWMLPLRCHAPEGHRLTYDPSRGKSARRAFDPGPR